jgi:predicted permease
MRTLGHDVRQGCRRLRQARGFSLFSIATLAVGIGATTAIQSVIQATLYQPLPFADPERVMNIYGADFARQPSRTSLSVPDFEDLRVQQTSFSDVMAWARVRATWGTAGQTVVTFGEAVTGNYFAVLGIGASLGRTLQPDDDRPGAPRVVVLSHDAWQRQFNGDEAIAGQTIKINGVPFEVAGVAARGFRGVDMPSILASHGWITLTAARSIRATRLTPRGSERDNTWLGVKGRLKPGVTITAASAELATIGARLEARFPRTRSDNPDRRAGRAFTAFPVVDLIVHESVHGIARTFSTTATVALVLVLLVACTSLANLQLGRLSTRRGEIAVRVALGASRMRVLRALVVESVLLSGVGLAAGLLVARTLMQFMTTDIDVVNGIVIDVNPRFEPAVLLLATLCAMLATLVAGLVPAWHTTRGNLRSTAAGQSGHLAARWRGRRFVIAAQVAVSAALLLVASIFGNRAWTMLHRDLGVDYSRLAAVQFDFSAITSDDQTIRDRLEPVLDAIRRSPGVETAFISSGLPIGFPTAYGVVAAEAGTEADWRRGPGPHVLAASPEIFTGLGFRLLRGRAFGASDQVAGEPPVVLSQQVARRLFDGSDPVGKTVVIRRSRAGADPNVLDRQEMMTARVAGVIEDVDASVPGSRERGLLVVPVGRWAEPRITITARMSEAATSASWLRDVVKRVNRDLPLVDVRTGTSLIDTETMFVRVGSTMTAWLGGIALLLGLVGLSGVLGHMVTSRTREIGIRIALGAGRRRVLRMIMVDGLWPVALGLVAGIAASFAIAQLLRGTISRLGGIPTFALVLIPLLLIAASLIACALPARRAAGVDPNVALREL